MNDPRDKKSICADCSSELSAKEEADAMISELREAGGSDLDSVIEASEATDGTAIGWTIVKINSDGSILCRDSRGTRRRFWFDNLQSSTTGNVGEQ